MKTTQSRPGGLSIDDLDTDYKALAILFKTPDEEEHVFNWWIDNDYNTDGAVRELHKYRLRIRDRERRRRKRLTPPATETSVIEPETCEPEDLVIGLTAREAEVWQLRALGLTYDEIAKQVGCAKSTVYEDLDRIQKKF